MGEGGPPWYAGFKARGAKIDQRVSIDRLLELLHFLHVRRERAHAHTRGHLSCDVISDDRLEECLERTGPAPSPALYTLGCSAGAGFCFQPSPSSAFCSFGGDIKLSKSA